MVLKNFQLSFRGQPLFQNFDVEIAPLKTTVLLGPSGCGKSTLLRVLSGLKPTGADISCELTHRFQRQSFVFQEPRLLSWKTALENILLPIELQRARYDQVLAQTILKQLNLTEVANLFPDQLSGGQKMRVSIGRALISQPEILFMDEPFSALDEPTRHELQDLVLELKNKFQMTLVFVTHSFYEAAYLADRVLILSNQKPTKIVYDESEPRFFKTRFEPHYYSVTDKITGAFQKLALRQGLKKDEAIRA